MNHHNESTVLYCVYIIGGENEGTVDCTLGITLEHAQSFCDIRNGESTKPVEVHFEARAVRQGYCYQSAKDWFATYGWITRTKNCGRIPLQVVAWHDLKYGKIVARDSLIRRYPALIDEEVDRIISFAITIYKVAKAVERYLAQALNAFIAGDIGECKAILVKASSLEDDHGGDPATLDLHRQLFPFVEGESQ